MNKSCLKTWHVFEYMTGYMACEHSLRPYSLMGDQLLTRKVDVSLYICCISCVLQIAVYQEVQIQEVYFTSQLSTYFSGKQSLCSHWHKQRTQVLAFIPSKFDCHHFFQRSGIFAGRFMFGEADKATCLRFMISMAVLFATD